MEQELQRIKEVALTAIKAATNQQALQDVRVKYLGKKGEVTALLKGLGKLSPEERPKMGALMNAVRETLEAELDKIKSSMETAAMNARLEEEKILIYQKIILHAICKTLSILQKISCLELIHLLYKHVPCSVMNLIVQFA